MKKPEPGNAPRGPKGRFIGIVGTGRERYQIHLLETVGDTVVSREILRAGRKDRLKLPSGAEVEVQGDGLAVTRGNFNTEVARHLVDVSDLWKP